jgi:hypothetical protein
MIESKQMLEITIKLHEQTGDTWYIEVCAWTFSSGTHELRYNITQVPSEEDVTHFNFTSWEDLLQWYQTKIKENLS